MSDTGQGMDAKTLEKIFDPFFSTKEGGIGLGLALALEIIRAHQGHISLTSKVGKGSTFIISLPLKR